MVETKRRNAEFEARNTRNKNKNARRQAELVDADSAEQQHFKNAAGGALRPERVPSVTDQGCTGAFLENPVTPFTTILPAGTFRVSDYRKSIPDRVKIQAVLNAARRGEVWVFNPTVNAEDIQFDHEPALEARPFDLAADDFIPAQLSIKDIIPRVRAMHLYKTTGRKPGADRTVTTRGSDNGEAAHVKAVRESQKIHADKMAAKLGDGAAINRLLTAGRKGQRKPKAKIWNRGVKKRHGPLW